MVSERTVRFVEVMKLSTQAVLVGLTGVKPFWVSSLLCPEGLKVGDIIHFESMICDLSKGDIVDSGGCVHGVI